MNKYYLIATTIILTGCGMNHKLNAPADPIKIQVSVDFESMSDLCDRRYGINTYDSDRCFEELVGFFDAKISLDIDSIQEYCEGSENPFTCVEGFKELLGPFED